MKAKLFSLFLTIFCYAIISAQDFIGYVKKTDSTASPIFQAKVEITEGDKPFKSLKTYFDGSFKFTPNKNRSYNVKITYSGYTDSTYTITSDKYGKVDAPSVTVSLKKDGMRLMGVIKSREEDFPIKGATIVLKNVMTRKEDRITTDIDGRYNFKLEYETNYKVWIDKRSVGILYLYKDTSFYISTIGFNLPLDYKLDVSLSKMSLPPVRHGRDTAKQPLNKIAEPIINVTANQEKPQVTLQDDNAALSGSVAKKVDKRVVKDQDGELIYNPIKVQTELIQSKTKPEKEDQKEILDGTPVIITGKKVKTKKVKESLEVVVIRDSVRASSANPSAADEKMQPLSELEIVRQKALAEKKAREIETQIAIKKAAEGKKRVEEIARQKGEENRLGLLQKEKEDSLVRVKQKNHSIMLANTQKKNAPSGSVPRTIDEAQRKVNSDSTVTTKTFYLTKTQEELIAAAETFAKRKKIVQDSIFKTKELELKKAEELKKNK